MHGSEESVFMDHRSHGISDGISVEGVRDQYADGKAAKVWEFLIGDKISRTENYKKYLVDLLRSKGCKRILDVAYGTGVDSVMLLEEGFEVVSSDASDKMLKYALRVRWNRRQEPAFENWVIEEANWLTLYDDLKDIVGNGFDAVICLGNSFAHVLDSYGDQRDQKQALRNFEKCLKPGGTLLIDHRNFDIILENGSAPIKSIYYNFDKMSDIKTSVIYSCSKPAMVTVDFVMKYDENTTIDFGFSYYPHELRTFSTMLQDIIGSKSTHKVYADFKDLSEVENPAFYIHLIEKVN